MTVAPLWRGICAFGALAGGSPKGVGGPRPLACYENAADKSRNLLESTEPAFSSSGASRRLMAADPEPALRSRGARLLPP